MRQTCIGLLVSRAGACLTSEAFEMLLTATGLSFAAGVLMQSRAAVRLGDDAKEAAADSCELMLR